MSELSSRWRLIFQKIAVGVIASVGSSWAADYQATVLSDRPIGYWRLGESSGTVATNQGSLGPAGNGEATDSVGFGQAGAVTGDANTAAAFDGTASKIEVPYGEALNGLAWTYEVWANVAPDSSGVHRAPLASRDDTPSGNTSGVIFYADPGDNWQLWNGRGSGGWNVVGGATVVPGQWTHLVGTFDGTNKAFYVDGVLVGADRTAFQPNRARVLRIGASANENPVGQFFFNGSLDEAAVYDHVLSGGSILEHYRAGSGNDPTIVAPMVVGEPQSLTVFNGESFSLSVLATGSLPLRYQWKFNETDIPGATNYSLTLSNAQPATGGAYRVTIQNSAGEAASADALVNVSEAGQPVITQQPLPKLVPAGATVTFSVSATGAFPLRYQWKLNDVALAGATNSSLTVTNVQVSNVGEYTVTVSNGEGSITSTGARLELPVAPTQSYDATVKADGPVGYWRLDEGLGETAFDSVGQNHGAYLNGVTLGVPGALSTGTDVALTNTAAQFQSSASQKVDVPFSPDLNPPAFSVELWAKVTGGDGSYRSPLTSRGDLPQRGYIFYAEPGNTWQFWTGGGDPGAWDTLAGPAVVSNEWTYLVGTFDGTTKRFYVNGIEVASSTPAFDPNTENPLRFGAGRSETDGDYFFEGSVDEVSIYNKALSATQVATHFVAGRPPVIVNPTTLTFTRNNGQITLTWSVMTLQEAPDVTGPWQNVGGATSPHTITPTGTRRFYRLQ